VTKITANHDGQQTGFTARVPLLACPAVRSESLGKNTAGQASSGTHFQNTFSVNQDVRWTGLAALAFSAGLFMFLAVAADPAAQAADATFFPNATKVYVPRGTAQLLKPYLPKPKGSTKNYRFVVATPEYLKYVACEKGIGSPPDKVQVTPAPPRNGINYTKHTALYEVYPTTGFELSICWHDADNHHLGYRPELRAGGTFDWTHFKQTITPPEGAAWARPLIIKWQKRGIHGSFWVDNVALRRADDTKNLITAGTFDEPAWKSGLLKPEGKDGSKCAKFVCPPELADRQQALWVHPDNKPIAVESEKKYVLELDLKAEGLGVPGEAQIASLLFRADETAPEGIGRIFTYCPAATDAAEDVRETELVILPPLKNVRPKTARIAPCLYAMTFNNPKVAEAYAENVWRSGITWTYGSMDNNVASILRARGHRVWLGKPGEPFAAHGAAGAFLKDHQELQAISFDGKPKGNLLCPTWLLSPDGAEIRRLMEDELVERMDDDGYTAVNWDIEQPVCFPPEGGGQMRGFCLCPRCLDAFRKQQNIPEAEKLDAQVVVDKHQDAWVAFRCRQNAELVGHVAKALKRCSRPIEFSVYSGYQCPRTRALYGVDWQMLAPHLDLAIAGYGGSRQAIRATLDALGKVPFIGGEMYYLSPAPRRAAADWIKRDMAIRPNPLQWRNRLLRQFVDGGCHGVLIWYLPTMDGGAFYYTSEAAQIIAAHEDIFQSGTRCDGNLRVEGIKPDHWAALRHQDKRLLMLLNFSGKDVTAQVEQPGLEGKWAVRVHGEEQALNVDPAKFNMPIEPWGARVVVFTKRLIEKTR